MGPRASSTGWEAAEVWGRRDHGVLTSQGSLSASWSPHGVRGRTGWGADGGPGHEVPMRRRRCAGTHHPDRATFHAASIPSHGSGQRLGPGPAGAEGGLMPAAGAWAPRASQLGVSPRTVPPGLAPGATTTSCRARRTCTRVQAAHITARPRPGQGQAKAGRTDRGAAVTDAPPHEAWGVQVSTCPRPARPEPPARFWCNDRTRRLTGHGRRNCHLLGRRSGFGRENKQLSIRSGPRKPEVPVRCPGGSAKRTATRRPWPSALLCRRGQEPDVLSHETAVMVQRRNFMWNLYRRKHKRPFCLSRLGFLDS